ncbi:DENN domain-containing protein 3, partial [Myotis lucifugus]|uniref:DENN domain-containing protein 3 n=1 Tax=Myotis lucifugus TaxID=59463 RepID=UPI000CCC987B
RETDTEDVSVPDGVDLLALPQLCFPGGLCVASEPQEDRVHFLVLTDVCGNRTYAAVAQYYRPLHDEHCFYGGKPPRESPLSPGAAGCFVPFAVCVISRFPYYNALRDCLSCLLTHLKLCRDFEVDNHIRDFAAKVSLIPSPPPGPLHLIFNLKPLQIVFPSRADPESPVIDLDLHLPLLCFRPEKVLQILACLLTEQRLVFFSASWALLTLVAECFLAYLHPLRWQHTLVPILSGQMLDFLMAPTAFLMGCHLSHLEEVSKVRYRWGPTSPSGEGARQGRRAVTCRFPAHSGPLTRGLWCVVVCFVADKTSQGGRAHILNIPSVCGHRAGALPSRVLGGAEQAGQPDRHVGRRMLVMLSLEFWKVLSRLLEGALQCWYQGRRKPGDAH